MIGNISKHIVCDEDMIKNIMPLIPEHFNQVRQAQDAELGRGGSDLVKIDFDPLLLTGDELHRLIEFKTNFDVYNTLTEFTFPLLENPDEILFWKNAQGKVSFYYANRQTQAIRALVPEVTSSEEQRALDVFKNSLDEMENNSARRSTNIEHQLIAKLMQQTLYRQGIRYSDAHGEHYCDSCTPFQLINCYRTVTRLYEEAGSHGEWEKAHHFWQEGVGRAQGEEMWLLQRICEWSRLFHLLPPNIQEFERGFIVRGNWVSSQEDEVFKDDRLVAGLGSVFALYKGKEEDGAMRRRNGVYLAKYGPADLRVIASILMMPKQKLLSINLNWTKCYKRTLDCTINRCGFLSGAGVHSVLFICTSSKT